MMIHGTIDAIAFGGMGILRHEGLVVFVPFTAPGDQVTCRIVEQKKNFAKAELLAIDHPSPHRVEPKCPYFTRCGGCQLQHLGYPAQVQSKAANVVDALKRIGQLSIPEEIEIVPANHHWGYRRHITLHFQQIEGKTLLGYFGTDNRTIVDIQCCPIFLDAPSEIFATLRTLLELIPGTGRVSLWKSHEGQFIIVFHLAEMPSQTDQIAKLAPSNCSLLFKTPSRQKTYGTLSSSCHIEGLEFEFSPEVFMQNHPEQSLKIYQTLTQHCQSSHNILDLYCGIGISSLLLAKGGAQVMGVESNGQAIHFAKANQKRKGLSNVHFRKAIVENIIDELLHPRPDTIIVNPPRTGLDTRVADALSNYKANTIVYISCMPSTLARDLKLLSKYYKINSLKIFDMFPQTGHIETMIELKRNSL